MDCTMCALKTGEIDLKIQTNLLLFLYGIVCIICINYIIYTVLWLNILLDLNFTPTKPRWYKAVLTGLYCILLLGLGFLIKDWGDLCNEQKSNVIKSAFRGFNLCFELIGDIFNK